MNIICKIFCHKPDLVKLVDNKINNNNSTNISHCNCKRCGDIITYDECFKKHSYEIITIIQQKLIKNLKNPQ